MFLQLHKIRCKGSAKENNCSPVITGEQWYNHFSNLHKDNFNENREGVNDLPKVDAVCNELNEPFSDAEFQIVIKSLKNDKAEGCDSILNEIIKYSPSII